MTLTPLTVKTGFDQDFQDGGRSKKNGAHHCFQNAVALDKIVGIAPYLEHRRTLIGCPFSVLYFDLGVTSRDKGCNLHFSHDNSIKKSSNQSEIRSLEIFREIFSLGARLSSKTGLVRLTLSRWRPIKENKACHFFSKCRNFVNNRWNCTN